MAIGNDTAKALKGAAALAEMLGLIGAAEDDNAVAKVMVENEIELRDLLKWALEHIPDHL